MAIQGNNGDSDNGCIGILAIIGICVAVAWARNHIGTAAMVVCAGAAIWLAWRLWEKHKLSETKRRFFELRFGGMLDNFKRDISSIETNCRQAENVDTSTEEDIKRLERELKSLT